MVRNTFLHVGNILGAHGLKGALSIYSHTRPASAVAGYSCWWVGDTPESAKCHTVSRCWPHGKRMLAEIDGVTDCSSAESLKGMKIWVPASEVATDEDEYLWEELIGCEVRQQDGEQSGTVWGPVLGTVLALEEYGAQDNLVVQTVADAAEPGEWVIPFTADIITEIEIDKKLILVDMPEGMDACFTPKF